MQTTRRVYGEPNCGLGRLAMVTSGFGFKGFRIAMKEVILKGLGNPKPYTSKPGTKALPATCIQGRAAGSFRGNAGMPGCST